MAGRAGLGPDRGKLLILRPERNARRSGSRHVPPRSAAQASSDPAKQINWHAGPRDSLEIGQGAIPPSSESSSGRRSVTRASEAHVVSRGETEPTGGSAGLFERPPWGRGDLVALLVWTAAIVVFFWDAVSLRRALFYFDITEINYPYRAFFAEELRAGRFSRWCPGLYCGLPLFSESQAGYLHPLKYLLYPWMADLAGVQPRHGALDLADRRWAPICWLRRHVGPAGALTGAAIFGASGYVWGHLIHTSMINALASVPFVIWGLESSWATGSMARGCAGRSGPGVSGLRRPPSRRAADHRPRRACTVSIGRPPSAAWRPDCVPSAWSRGSGRLSVVLLSAVQWVPSKELLDRSPRAGGLSWAELTYGSWYPELLADRWSFAKPTAPAHATPTGWTAITPTTR